MKRVFIFTLAIVASINLQATVGKNKIIHGVVKSFNKTTVTIEVDEKKVNIPKDKIAKDIKLKTGMILDVELTEKEFEDVSKTAHLN